MTSMNSEPVILKQDDLGRVRISVERREALLEEFDRSGASGAKFARMAGVKYSTFAAWMRKRRLKRSVTAGQLCPRPLGNGSPIPFLEAIVEGDAPRSAVFPGLLIELPGGSRARVESPAQLQMAAELVSLIAQRAPSRC